MSRRPLILGSLLLAAFAASEIPGAELLLLEDTRHFLFEDEPERCAREVIHFLRRAGL